MKKFFKALALVLALALVIGVVPAQATSAKIKAKKTLYVDGAKGTNADGTKTSSYKERVAIYKLAGAKKADKEDHKFTAKIKSGDSVTVSKNYVYAAGLGKSVVELFKDGESLGTSVITVKKNATADTLTITEFEDGKEVVCGVEYTVTLPRKGVDSDERRLFVDDKAVADKEDAPRAYAVKFTKAGDHKVKFEAFQGGDLDKATASKEITVKAVMPKPVSAKQVSANSFSVEFEGSMKDLISKDDIANQDIYYLILQEKVVTGVIKSVEVSEADPKVVTITMYSNFNQNTDYYFAYGAADPISFHTAKNDIKEATSMKLIEQKAYYVNANTPVVVKFYNKDGVELDITEQVPAFTYDSDVAYLTGDGNIYFFKEGTATIKATITVGYEEETNAPIKLEDSITVTGVTKTTSQTGKVYSFGADPAKEKHTIRMSDTFVTLKVKYKLSDGSEVTLDTNTNTEGYYLKSADETVAVIKSDPGSAVLKATVEGVNPGKTYIILCDANNKEKDAFQIEVLPAQRAATADIYFDADTLNLNDLNGDSNLTNDDALNLIIDVKDLDGNACDEYKYTVEQAANNADAVRVKFNGKVANVDQTGLGAKKAFAINPSQFTDNRTGTGATEAVATVRFTVTVKAKDAAGTTIATKNISLAVSNQASAKANAWVLNASENALDSSIKNWKTADLENYDSVISVDSVARVNGYDFFIAHETFELVDSISDIPVTLPATTKNYVIASYRSDANCVATNGAVGALTDITINAFPAASTQAKTGTYTFTGYHVVYAANADPAQNLKGVRSAMGTQQVVISQNDVVGTVEILKGKASDLAGSLNDVFKVTWEGITTNAGNTGRVIINSINSKPDATTGAIFVYSINVTYTVNVESDPARVPATTIFTFTKDIAVNKLFK